MYIRLFPTLYKVGNGNMLITIFILLLVVVLYPLLEDLYLMYLKCMPIGPLSLPLVLNMHLVKPRQQQYSIKDLAQKYGGVISLRLGFLRGQRIVFIQDYELIKQILNSSQCAARPLLPFFDYVCNREQHGIGSRPYDVTWKLHTRIIHTALTKIHSSCLHIKLDNSFNLLFKTFDSSDNQPLEPSQVLRSANLSILASVVFGRRIESLDDPFLHRLGWIHRQYESGLTVLHPMNICPFLGHTRMFTNINKATKMRDDIMNSEYVHHMKEYTGEVHDVMDILVGAMNGGNCAVRLTEQQRSEIGLPGLLMSVFTLFMAGETNKTSVELWIMQYLAQYQDTQEIIYLETQRVSQGEIITSTLKHKMPYTVAFLYELLRHVTPNHFGVPRMTTGDVTVEDKVLPQGTTVFCNLWYVHHNEKLWPEPEKFKPERFLTKDGSVVDKKTMNNMPFLPFGWGKRVCIGQKIAVETFFTFTARLVQHYRVNFSSDNIPDMRGRTGLSLTPSPCDFMLHKRISIT